MSHNTIWGLEYRILHGKTTVVVINRIALKVNVYSLIPEIVHSVDFIALKYCGVDFRASVCIPF